ncbi:MAG TPA: hypothetical protein VGK59_15105 [Ohtaekwangia sp.]
MRKLMSVLALTSYIVISGFSFSPQHETQYRVECCKICKKGKACGDSCISRDYECHKPQGCACNG